MTNDRFKNVLFVGPHYELRGGMASVLKVYAETIPVFNFLPTYFHSNPVKALVYYAGALLRFIWLMISKRNIRIVHIHTASRGSFFRKSILIHIARIAGRKTVLHIHGGEFKVFYANAGLMKGYIRYTLNNTGELLCLSDEWKHYFDSITEQKKTLVLNNPVVIPHQVTLKKVSHPIVVLYLNHLNEKKGLFDVTSFFNNNRSWLEGHVKLVIAGAGESEKLEQFISNNQLQHLIEYKGWVSGQAKEDLLQQCDVFILTSYNEGLPVSILEAMARKKAIIASNVGGIPRIVKPGENGWLMKAGDEAALVTVFKEIISRTEILETYGAQSHRIAQDYSPEKVQATLEFVYNGLLNNNPLPVNRYQYEKD